MLVVWTILACLALYIVQGWLLQFLLIFSAAISQLPSHLVVRTIPSGPDIEGFAGEHPWRIHLAALLFRFGCVSNALFGWLIILALINAANTRWPEAVSWGWVYGLSFIIFLGSFNNARTLNSQYNSLSFRLKSGSSELRYRHGHRHQAPDEVLGPIPVTRHGF
jgi:hypothetical protein